MIMQKKILYNLAKTDVIPILCLIKVVAWTEDDLYLNQKTALGCKNCFINGIWKMHWVMRIYVVNRKIKIYIIKQYLCDIEVLLCNYMGSCIYIYIYIYIYLCVYVCV